MVKSQIFFTDFKVKVTNNVRGLGLNGLRMVVVYLVGMCFAQNRKGVVRLLRSNVP